MRPILAKEPDRLSFSLRVNGVDFQISFFKDHTGVFAESLVIIPTICSKYLFLLDVEYRASAWLNSDPPLPMLTQVDCLEFTILVDNSIEWMTKLPPGFSSEVRLHLEKGPPIDPVLHVPILDLDHYCCGAHGLAILIVSHCHPDSGTCHLSHCRIENRGGRESVSHPV